MMPPTDLLDRLGCYGLAGAPESPRELLDEVRAAEALGLGQVFISERYNVKESATLCGAAAAVSERIGITAGVTNHNTRHPMVTASFAATMHHLSGGRFSLGLGRGIQALQDIYGIDRITTAQLEDAATVLRTLLNGGMIGGHDGPIGSYPLLHLDTSIDAELPLLVAGFGPATLDLAGRCFDGVILHTFFDDDTTTRAVQRVKRSAEAAGRDPDDVTVWSCYATVGDHLAEPLRLKKTVGRLATYLQGYGDLLVSTNGWDPAPLAAFRADPLVATFAGGIDHKATTEQLEHIGTLIPEEWLAAAATGSPRECANSVLGQFELGCDAVILHGATPTELEPVVAELASIDGQR